MQRDVGRRDNAIAVRIGEPELATQLLQVGLERGVRRQ